MKLNKDINDEEYNGGKAYSEFLKFFFKGKNG